MSDHNPNDGSERNQHQPAPPAHAGRRKRNTSRRNVGLLVASGMLFIAIILATINFVNTSKPKDCSAPGSCAQALPFTQNPATANAIKGRVIALDSNAGFEVSPAWDLPALRHWETINLGEEGATGIRNVTLGCTLIRALEAQEVDSTASSDLPSTTNMINQLRDAITSVDPHFEVVSESNIDLALRAVGSGEYIEFATIRLNYSIPGGEYTSVFFARSLPHSGSYMVAQLDCPRGVFDGEDSPLREVTEKLVVVPQR